MPLPMVMLLEASRHANKRERDLSGTIQLIQHTHQQIELAVEKSDIDFPCPICGSQMKLVPSEEVYKGRDYSRDGQGNTYRWICGNWPQCNTHIGCHGNTYVPLGTPAGYGLRVLRQRCHGLFDRLWKGGVFKRNEAYKWLAHKMGINLKDCHIGSFDSTQCRIALKILDKFWSSRE